ncbi:Katanin p60 ATPase-containing subunit A1 [Operophtera brumata]|uniref:Katanin p60 ATPase-containing subunit A1 n=1 Tax=Operophtera brumata TaxID=104452 RepID=A0A0L7LVK5_OPEBR|nr:Katanin p60 ATPase-containing subunit A1 [Operophtera brumata]
MDYSFGDSLVPNVPGLTQFFRNDPFFGPSTGFHQMARMMDRMMVDSMQPFGFARMTTRRNQSSRGDDVPPQQPRDGLRTEKIVRPTQASTFLEQPLDQNKQTDPTTEKWATTLRRRDPDIQATLPSITKKSSSTSSSVGSGRKCRSVERVPRVRGKHLAPMKFIGKKDIPNEGTDVTIYEKDEKVFDSTGYEVHLVDTLERDILQKNPDVRWRDVIGLEDAKSVLKEAMVLPLFMPDYFKGIRRPWKGVLLTGPPGTGKTLLARAVASECKTTFFNVSSATLTSKYRGDSEKLVRLLFDMTPSTRLREDSKPNCSFRWMDLLPLSATNHPWDIDEAFRRRFEKRIYIGLPDEAARVKLLKLCLREVVLAEGVLLPELASKLNGYSGSDICNLCRFIRRLKRAELDAPVSTEDLLASIEKTKRTVTQADVARYF